MATVTFSGIASGIDADAIIKATMDAKRTASKPLENKVTDNTAESDALEEFRTKMFAFNDALQEFRALVGGAVSKKGASSNEDAVSIVAGNGASVSSTTIDVQQLAKSASFSFDDRFTSSSTPLVPGLSGNSNIDITVGSGTSAQTVSISIDNTTTLSGLAQKISEQLAGKVNVSIVNTGTEAAPQFALMMNTTETGASKGTLQVSVGSDITGAGVFTSSTMQQAQDSIFSVAGLGTITRSGNKISDLLPGITFELKQENTGPVSLGVTTDAEKTADRFEKVITAYNELVKYSSDNSTIERVDDSRGVTNKYGSLARNRVDDQAVEEIRNTMSGMLSSVATDSVNTFADLGITLERDGTYSFKRDTFIDSVSKEPEAAHSILTKIADRLGSTDGIVANYTRFQGQIDVAITSNSDENERINDKLARLEDTIARQTEAMRLMFSRLEAKVGELNSTQSSLSQIIAGGFGTGR